jgi:type I restriction enzyme S subunit
VIAPLAEQRRIVAKLKPLLGKVDAYQQRLAKIPAILKRFRQAVLTAACSGRLTVDWRTSEPQAESDRELILKIHRQREEICKAVSKTKGLNSTVSSSASRMQPSPGPEYEVPASWQFASMDELTCLITSGSRDWKKYYSDDGPGTFIMAQNVRPLKYDRSYRLGVNPPANDKDRTRSEVRQNDLLVTIVGANTGDVCRILEPIENHYVCQSVALMRPVLPETSAFIELFLNSISHGQDQYRHMIYGGGRPHLSFDNLRETVIALPPLAEQQEIVSRVETFFKLADQIEARYQRAKPLVDKLPQSILAKAFRGELVPTEAEIARREGRDYEPASVLLERIRSERTEHAQGRKGKAKSQPKPTKGKVSGVAISKS